MILEPNEVIFFISSLQTPSTAFDMGTVCLLSSCCSYLQKVHHTQGNIIACNTEATCQVKLVAKKFIPAQIPAAGCLQHVAGNNVVSCMVALKTPIIQQGAPILLGSQNTEQASPYIDFLNCSTVQTLQ